MFHNDHISYALIFIVIRIIFLISSTFSRERNFNREKQENESWATLTFCISDVLIFKVISRKIVLFLMENFFSFDLS